MSFAYETLTEVPDGTKKIQYFMVHDQVLAGLPTGTNGLDWRPSKVSFSSGSGKGGRQPAMIYIRFGEDAALICTANQYFLLPNGKIKRADRLIPNRDTLTDRAGESVAISQISVGEFSGGIHHIATDAQFNGSLDNHLLLTAGVVAGDYHLEVQADELREQGLVEE